MRYTDPLQREEEKERRLTRRLVGTVMLLDYLGYLDDDDDSAYYSSNSDDDYDEDEEYDEEW